MTERGQVRFGATTIEYTVIRSRRRRKTIEITLDPGEGVLVAAPVATSCEQIKGVVTKRAGWIVRRASSDVLQPRLRQFVSGESLPYLGRQVRLFVEPADAKRVTVRFNHWSFQITAPAQLSGEGRRAAIERAFTTWYRQRATERLTGGVERWSRVIGCTPPSVLIRAQRQRWGSCGPDGTLRLNWRIIMAPPALIDYVVVHELVHLRVRNHSAAFWHGISTLMPDHKLRRACLRELGPSLSL